MLLLFADKHNKRFHSFKMRVNGYGPKLKANQMLKAAKIVEPKYNFSYYFHFGGAKVWHPIVGPQKM